MIKDNYFKIPALSNSDLGYLSKSIKHYINYKNNPPQETQAMIFGSALHCYLLEKDEFFKRFIIMPERPEIADGRAKKGSPEKKAYDMYKTQLEEIEGSVLTLLKYDDFLLIQMLSDLATQKLLECGYDLNRMGKEEVIEWTYKGIDCKAKVDIITPLENTIIDIKTIDEASDYNILQAVKSRGYYRQQEWYKLGLKDAFAMEYDPKFLFLFIEKKEPYDIRLVELEKDWEYKGKDEINALIERYKYYQNFNEVEGRGDLLLKMPSYLAVVPDA